jgi:hypothetical protein
LIAPSSGGGGWDGIFIPMLDSEMEFETNPGRDMRWMEVQKGVTAIAGVESERGTCQIYLYMISSWHIQTTG